MKRPLFLLAALAFSLCVSAQDVRHVWFIHPFRASGQSIDVAMKWRHEFGQQNVLTTYVKGAYVVLVRMPEGSVNIPDNHPMRWAQFATADEALAEYNKHADAESRALITMYDGAAVVFWTKALAAPAER